MPTSFLPRIICILPPDASVDGTSDGRSDVIDNDGVVADDDDWREDGDDEEVSGQADIEEVVKAGPTDELPEDGKVEDSGDKSDDKTSC